MVGVPRSQGCKQCRRKKKGCDLERPQCGQCSKAGVHCEYTQRLWTFVPQEARSASAASSSSERVIVQGRSLSRTALESQVLEDFWARYLPQDPPGTVDLGITFAPWCRFVQAQSCEEDGVCLALKAVAFMALGRLDRTPEYVRYACGLYARTLHATNKALRDTTRSTSDATVANCKLLGIYEQFRLEVDGSISTQGTDWQRHVAGICRIMELRGPQTVASASGHVLFQDAKAMAAISGLTRRKTTFFTSDEWADTWKFRSKTMRDELLDIFIALPCLLQRQDQLLAAIDGATPLRDATVILEEGVSLLQAFLQLGTRLHDWERSLLQRAVGEHTATTTTTPELPDGLLSICQSHGYGVFHLISQFWTTALVLSSSMHLTRVTLFRCAPSSDLDLPQIPPYLNPSTFASNISQTASHFFLDSAGLINVQLGTFPIGVALYFYAATRQQQSEEMRQLKSVLAHGQISRMAIANDFLRSIAMDAAAGAPPDIKRGDQWNPGDHEKMASQWFRGKGKAATVDGADLGGQ